MPWATSTVYLHDTPDARAVLAADPALKGHLFALDLAAVELPPRTAAGSRLLAVRSPVRPRDLPLVGDGFDWKGLDGALAARLAPARSALEGASSRIAPPDKPLRWLEDLAARVCAPVVWYMAEAVASDPEAEIAWVIDWRGPATVEDEPLDRSPCVYSRRDRRVLRLSPAGAAVMERDTLGAGLLHLGVRLDGTWFTPHRPDFDWGALRLEASP